MKARFLALAVVVAWPSLAHADWFGDTIGRPISDGLAQGAHVIKGSMITGARQTTGAFRSAAREAGIDRSRTNAESAPGVEARSASGDAAPSRPAGADKIGPGAPTRP